MKLYKRLFVFVLALILFVLNISVDIYAAKFGPDSSTYWFELLNSSDSYINIGSSDLSIGYGLKSDQGSYATIVRLDSISEDNLEEDLMLAQKEQSNKDTYPSGSDKEVAALTVRFSNPDVDLTLSIPAFLELLNPYSELANSVMSSKYRDMGMSSLGYDAMDSKYKTSEEDYIFKIRVYNSIIKEGEEAELSYSTENDLYVTSNDTIGSIIQKKKEILSSLILESISDELFKWQESICASDSILNDYTIVSEAWTKWGEGVSELSEGSFFGMSDELLDKLNSVDSGIRDAVNINSKVGGFLIRYKEAYENFKLNQDTQVLSSITNNIANNIEELSTQIIYVLRYINTYRETGYKEDTVIKFIENSRMEDLTYSSFLETPSDLSTINLTDDNDELTYEAVRDYCHTLACFIAYTKFEQLDNKPTDIDYKVYYLTDIIILSSLSGQGTTSNPNDMFISNIFTILSDFSNNVWSSESDLYNLARSGGEEDAMTIAASQVLVSGEAYIGAKAPPIDEENKLVLDTLLWRLKLAFYSTKSTKVQVQDELAFVKNANIISLSSAGDTDKPNEIYAVNVGNILNPNAYLDLMNVFNQLYSMRYGVASKLYEMKLQDNPDTTEINRIKSIPSNMAQIKRLSIIKNCIDFLQPFSQASVEYDSALTGYNKLSDVIYKIWYEEIGEYGSLATLYRKLQEYKIDMSAITNYNVDTVNLLPLRDFFSISNHDINPYLKLGMINSSTYLPLRTNVYDPHIYTQIEEDNFLAFHYKYGYLRKAILIDTNHSSAVQLHNTEQQGTLRVATLRDLLKDNFGDVTLYSDDNFYNIEELSKMQDKMWNKLDGGDDAQSNSKNIFVNFWRSIVDYFTLDTAELTKSINHEKYSAKLSNIQSYSTTLEWSDEKTENQDISSNNHNLMLLGGKQIDDNISFDKLSNTSDNQILLEDYSVLTPYAFVSAVYRDTQLFEFLSKSPSREPIFISSRNLCYVDKVGEVEKQSIYNYALLQNLESQRTLSYETNLDMDSPLYLDIYGNILTESGYVVVPFAANATMNTKYSIFNAALFTTYGKKYSIPYVTDSDLPRSTSNYFEVSENGEVWDLKAQIFEDLVDTRRLSEADIDTMNQLKALYSAQFELWGSKSVVSDPIDFRKYIKYIFMEVVRGAPLEYIDKDREGINPVRRLSVSGIVAAVKMDEFRKSLGTLTSNNTFLNLPNPAFMPGVEYIVLITYKLLILMAIVLVIIQIAVMGIKGQFGTNILLYVLATLVTVTAMVFIIPKTYSITYYEANKSLLQNEARTIAIYNLEKREQGVELGMTSISPPGESSTLLLKISDIHIPWYNLLSKIVEAPISDKLSEIYSEYLSTNLASSVKQFEVINDGIYIDVYKLLQSSKVDINLAYHQIQFSADAETPASFYTPYYFFLNQLVYQVNDFNSSNRIRSYTTSMYNGGKIKSLGIIKSYFTNPEFLEGEMSEDLLGIMSLYSEEISSDNYLSSMFSFEQLEAMKRSYWFNDNILNRNNSEDDIRSRSDKVTNHMLDFIKLHHDLIGSVSDETFLKILALETAMYYNKVFNIDSCSAYELYKLQPDDLLRISIADERTVMEGIPYSFSRYIYSISGQVGIYVAALLDAVIFIAGISKSIMTFLFFALVFASLFIYKLVLKKEESSITGYFIVTGLLCLTNLAYALLLKICMKLPALGITPLLCMVILILLQLIILVMYITLLRVVIVHWRDLGSARFKEIAKSIVSSVNVVDGVSEAIREGIESGDENWKELKEMRELDAQRENAIGGDQSRDDPFGHYKN